MANTWPNIPLARTKMYLLMQKWKGKPNKIEHFSRKPGKVINEV